MTTRWKPSVTVAAVIERDGLFLLVEEETSEGLKLNNAAGHLDPGESPEDGCSREALEETAYLLRTPANAKRLLAAAAQLNAGKGVERKLAK